VSVGPSAPAAPRLVSIMLAAMQLSVSERHLRGLIARGLVPAVRIGRRCLIAHATLDRIATEGIKDVAG
jgi:excisionase family DNA binding protein